MVTIRFHAAGFPRSVRRSGVLHVSRPRLAWAAVTVGYCPLGPPAPPRPQLELAWRAAMVGANLSARGGGWRRSEAYMRLDGSEKSAVSYFLGMTQAKLAADLLLGFPYLVHLDAVLRLLGRPTRRSRPDFLALDVRRRAAASVEAKGRTHGYSSRAMTEAKAQAARLPSVTGFSTPLRFGALAWFDNDGEWNADLSDPPARRVRQGLPERVAPVDSLVAYYQPVVRAIRGADGQTATIDQQRMLVMYDAVTDLTVGVPTSIVELVESGEPSKPVDPEDALAPWLDVLASGPGSAEMATRSTAAREEDERRCVGADRVFIELGTSWYDAVWPAPPGRQG